MFKALPVKLTFIFSLIASALLIYSVETNRYNQKKLVTQYIANNYIDLIQNKILQTLSATYPIAALVQNQNGSSEGFTTLASGLLPFYSNANSLQITRNGVIQNIYPLQGNEAALGFDVFSSPQLRYEALKARESGQLTLTGPLELVQGGQAIIGRLPIYLATDDHTNTFWGFSVALIRIPELLASIDLSSLEDRGYSFRLYRYHPETQIQQLISQSSTTIDKAPLQLTIALPETEWKLDISPKSGWFSSAPVIFETLIALFFSLFLATSFASLRQKDKASKLLESTVKQRTREIDDHLKRLQLSFRAANQRSFDLNVKTGEITVSNEYSEKFGFSPGPTHLTLEKWKQNIHPDDVGRIEDIYDQCIHDNIPQNCEYRQRNKEGHWLWIYATGEVIEWDEQGCAARVIGIHKDITKQKQNEQVLRALAETKSASNSEDDILKVIVKQLALAYDMKYALISVIDEKDENLAQTLAVWADSDYIDNMSYSLIGTPCSDVLTTNTGVCHYPNRIQKQFPLDRLLTDMEAESYTGMQLVDSNDKTIGLIALLDTRTHDPKTLPPLDLMKSLAVRAGNEIERQRAEARLTLSARVFEQAREGIIITDANSKIIDVNPTFCQITGYTKEEVVGKPPSILSSGRQNTDFYQNMWYQIGQEGHWQGEVWNRKKSGELYAELLTISSLKDEHGEVLNYVGLFSDITSSKEQQQQLELIAHYDILTKLPNRTLFANRFTHALAHAQRNNSLVAICFLDLDNFKPVNDTYGHDVGDMVLIEMANRIQNSIRKEDTLSRQGGDEFALLLEDLESVEHCEETLKRILSSLSQPYPFEDHFHQISASIGATIYPDDNADLDTLLRHADQAMYLAKLAGKNQYQFFNTSQNEKIIQIQTQIKEIKLALEQNEFCLYYQPKVNMKTGEVFGVEALIRWQHPEKGLVPPLKFLPLIDGNILEIQVGQWVIEEAIRQLDEWQEHGLEPELSINISSYHLLSSGFLSHLEEALARYPNLDCRFLQLEILESSALSDLEKITSIIKTCRTRFGIEVALDDFGTGYSSLTHLRNLPANTIKIDQSFIRDMLDDPNDYAIVEGVIRLASTFNRDVIAEGVETTGHGLLLLLMGCEFAQGYGISKPMPADELINWVNHVYSPNLEWIDCANKVLTPKEREAKLLGLTIDSWQALLKSNLSAARPVFEWSSLDSSQCHCKAWITKARQEALFSPDWLDMIERQHETMHTAASKLIRQIREQRTELSNELFTPIDRLVEHMHETITEACRNG